MATVYLAPSPTGDDSRTYAQAQNPATPWATIGKVISSATNGDTVEMAAGTYTWNSQSVQTLSFTWNGAALANGAPQVIWDGSAAAVRWQHWAYPHTFNRIKFYNAKSSGTQAIFDCNYTGVTRVNDTLTFNDCVFDTLWVEGFVDNGNLFDDYSNSNPIYVFSGCVFSNIKRVNPSGQSYAVLFAARSTTVSLTNCTLYLNASGADALTSVFVRNTTSGTYSVTLTNCALQTANAIVFSDGNAITQWSVTYSWLNGFTVLPSLGAGCGTTDPKFVDPTNGDFHLAQDSPCRGTGTYL